jgi:TetR/AcrR family transcriptional regulator, tetracycline repressor protein
MTLQRSQIVATALELLNQDGLDGVTVRKVAKRLNVHVGGLYWHVKNKQDLLDEMANTILSEEFPTMQPPEPGQAWSDWLVEIAQRLRKAMLAYREGGRVVAGAHLHRAVTLAQLFICIADALRAAGFQANEARWLCVTVVSYTFGFVIEEQAGPTPDTIAQLQATGLYHPLLTAVLEDVSASNRDRQTDFNMGLHYIITGAQASRGAATM